MTTKRPYARIAQSECQHGLSYVYVKESSLSVEAAFFGKCWPC